MKTAWKAWAAFVGVAVSGAASLATSQACPPQDFKGLGPTRSVQLTAAAPVQRVVVDVTSAGTIQDVVVSARRLSGTAAAVHLSRDGMTPGEESSDAGASTLTMSLCPGSCGPGTRLLFLLADQVDANDPVVMEFSVSAPFSGCASEETTVSYR